MKHAIAANMRGTLRDDTGSLFSGESITTILIEIRVISTTSAVSINGLGLIVGGVEKHLLTSKAKNILFH